MFKLFVLVAILVAFVGANYNFQDSDFNQLLFDDLTETADHDDELLRFRRATVSKQCRRKRIKLEDENHCCGSEGKGKQKDTIDAIKEMKKKCLAEVRANHVSREHDPLKCNSVLTLREQIVCACECLAKKFDLIDDNGDFKRDALLNIIRKIIGDNTWKAGVVEEYVDKCLHEIDASNGVSDATKDGACNSKPLDVHHCIWKKFTQGCPSEMQINNEKCERIRQHLAKSDVGKSLERSSQNSQ